MNITDYKTFTDRFTYYFNNFNIEFTDVMMREFYIFTEYLTTENTKYNLTAITDLDNIIAKHYIDSIIILKYIDIPENSMIIDIGAGAGFPSVPLRIFRKDLDITFLDSSEKKINFIKNALNELGLTNKNIFYSGRAEEAGKKSEYREKYDFAVSRAVAKLNVLCELAAPLIKQGGYFIAYKSKNTADEIKESDNALNLLGLKITETIEFNISPEINDKNNKRTLIKIKKLNKTSPKYPRNFSNITKNPL